MTVPPTTTPQVTEIVGDANDDGKLDVRDAACIARMLAQRNADKLPAKADFNGDGKIDVRDAAAIARFLAKNIKISCEKERDERKVHLFLLHFKTD